MSMVDWTSAFDRSKALKILGDTTGLLREKTRIPLPEDPASLAKHSLDYTQPYTERDFYVARQVLALYQKSEWLDFGIDTEAVALARFYEAEEMCRLANDRINSDRPRGRVSVVLHYAQRKVSEVLGAVPALADLHLCFGPGATTSVKSSVASSYRKLGASLACSEDALPVVGAILAEAPMWALSSVGAGALDHLHDGHEVSVFPNVEIHSGKLVFVQKSAMTKRSIVVEPVLNGFVQKGIGSYIRDRLLAVTGVNLRDQSTNRRLACEGSITDKLATIDLSMASDTLSIGVVAELLPYPWFDFLSNYRTGDVRLSDKRIVLEKFSSMGNAYTFELESLLFYSLCYGVARVLELPMDKICVYGDDIIMPSEGVPLLTEILDYCGFRVNSLKSFTSGPFRESCGADWFMGTDIRPFYLKKRLSDRTLYSFHNNAMRAGERSLATHLHDYTYAPIRLYGPDGFGDGHMIGSYSLRSNRHSRRGMWEGGYFDTYALSPRVYKRRHGQGWVHPFYSVYTRLERSRLSHLDESIEEDPFVVKGSDGYAKISVYTFATSIFGR